MEHPISKIISDVCPLATVVSTYPLGHVEQGALPTQLRFELPRSLLTIAGGWNHLAPVVKRLRGGAAMSTVKPGEFAGGEAKLRLVAECLDDMNAIAEVAEYLDAKIGIGLASMMFKPTAASEDLRQRRLNSKLGRNV